MILFEGVTFFGVASVVRWLYKTVGKWWRGRTVDEKRGRYELLMKQGRYKW
jgi:hypothetical protein